MPFRFAIPLIIFCFGAAIGSFLNVCIHRLPRLQSVVFPASNCPLCHHQLAWWENIPLVSYLLLRGRCSHCHGPISWRYPAVELLTALLFLVLYHHFLLSVEFMIYSLFIAMLIVVTFTDLEHRIIPDAVSLPGILLGVAASFLNREVNWIDSMLGVLVGGGALLAVAWGYYLITGKEGMGGGDIKLLAMIGAFLGWKAIPMVIFISALAGSVIGAIYIAMKRSGDRAIPYGPFLAAAAVVVLFWGPELWSLYLGLLA